MRFARCSSGSPACAVRLAITHDLQIGSIRLTWCSSSSPWRAGLCITFADINTSRVLLDAGRFRAPHGPQASVSGTRPHAFNEHAHDARASEFDGERIFEISLRLLDKIALRRCTAQAPGGAHGAGRSGRRLPTTQANTLFPRRALRLCRVWSGWENLMLRLQSIIKL